MRKMHDAITLSKIRAAVRRFWGGRSYEQLLADRAYQAAMAERSRALGYHYTADRAYAALHQTCCELALLGVGG